jgi:hypothetical protein
MKKFLVQCLIYIVSAQEMLALSFPVHLTISQLFLKCLYSIIVCEHQERWNLFHLHIYVINTSLVTFSECEINNH